MKKRKLWLFVCIAIFIAVGVLLAMGSSMLTMALDADGTIPAGTIITWLGLIALPLAIYFGSSTLRSKNQQPFRLLSVLLKISIVLAVLWVPICYLLAGNLSFSFSEKASFQGGQQAMRWFWRFTYGVVIGPILILLVYWLISFFKKPK